MRVVSNRGWLRVARCSDRSIAQFARSHAQSITAIPINSVGSHLAIIILSLMTPLLSIPCPSLDAQSFGSLSTLVAPQ